MINLVLFGPPGAGKGTQSAKLTSHYDLIHLSTGDIFRSNIKNGTELGLLAKSYSDKGNLVPDEVTINMVQSEVKKFPDAKGFIFDGFPRNAIQAKALDEFLQSMNGTVTVMLGLEVPDEELKNRLLIRGKDSGRPDDQNPDIIENRIRVYHEETAPVQSYYEAQGKYRGIVGVGSIDEIFSMLCKEIDAAI